ncbi:hypothetical protein WDU94_013632, partial [Cyamophila willieti]
GEPKFIRFGLITKLSSSVYDNIHKIARCFVHPNYTGEHTVHYDDIGLVQVAQQVEFSETLRPACLNVNHHIGHKTAIASGFGKLKYFGKSEWPGELSSLIN